MYIALFISLLLITSNFIHLSSCDGEEEEWGVHLFDSESFVIKKAYDAQRFHNDHLNLRFQTIYGLNIDILVTEGSVFTLTIADITENQIHSLLEYENRSLLVINGFIQRTVQNKTYWETIYENQDHIFVTDDLIKVRIENEYGPYTYLYMEEWCWKTGWLERYFRRTIYNQTLMFELEIQKINPEPLISLNMVYGGVILLFILTPLIISHWKSYQKRKMKITPSPT